jgi:cytochrome b6-f complex iron-sulfur subunit
MVGPTEQSEGPLDRAKRISRRKFLDYSIATCFGLGGLTAVSMLLAYLWPTASGEKSQEEKMEVGTVDEFDANSSKLVKFKNKPVLIIKTSAGFSAMSAICSHLGCIVKWDQAKNAVACPCHAAFFDIKGKVLSGPPSSPLMIVPATVVDGIVYIGKG